MKKDIIANFVDIMPVLVGIVFSALAQICMKKATTIDVKTFGWFMVLSLSMFCYALSFLSYYFALKSFPVSKVGPVMTVGVVALVVLLGTALGEVITLKQVAGLVLSICSILLIMC